MQLEAVVVLFPDGGLRRVQPVFSPASACFRKEIADGSLHFPSQGGALQPPMSTIRSEGNKKRQPQRNISSDRTSENAGKLKDPSIFNGEKFRSYTQEEIFALFRRIQTSISKGRPALSRRRNPKEKQSPDPVPAGTSRQFPRRKARGDEYKETATIVDNHTSSEENKDSPHNSNASEDKPSDNVREHRPISKFVKRSPIVPRSLNKNNASEPATGQLPQLAEHEVLELQKINEMKVLELKELARRKGIKGYSKLKKGELLEVLKGLLQPSL